MGAITSKIKNEAPVKPVEPNPEAPKPAEPSLFERFGGEEKMTLFVDEVVTRFLEDPDLRGPHA